MSRYLIETPHTGKECVKLIEEIQAQGYLHHFDWGCEAGVHCGWAIIETKNENQARLVVPPILRDKARVIKLSKYFDEDVKSLHPSN